jgi:uncharacterized protein (UPF0210 family)
MHGLIIPFGQYYSSGTLWGRNFKGPGNRRFWLMALGGLVLMGLGFVLMGVVDDGFDHIITYALALPAGMCFSFYTWHLEQKKCFAGNHIISAVQDVPFMAGAYLGIGEPDVVINVGVSGPGVVKKAIDRAKETHSQLTLSDVAEVIKSTAYKVTRVGELIGKEVADRMNLPFGVADLSLAPTPAVGDSVGEIFQSVGLSSIGAPGSTAVLAMLNDAVKKGGVFASSHVGGLSGAFIPVSEDSSIEAAANCGALTMEKLEAMTSVCSVGLDMIAIPGDTPATTISGLIADEMAIGMINTKTTAVRVIPVPGKGVGETAVFGGLLGKAKIIPVHTGDASAFINLGGRIPAPIHSLKN